MRTLQDSVFYSCLDNKSSPVKSLICPCCLLVGNNVMLLLAGEREENWSFSIKGVIVIAN